MALLKRLYRSCCCAAGSLFYFFFRRVLAVSAVSRTIRIKVGSLIVITPSVTLERGVTLEVEKTSWNKVTSFRARVWLISGVLHFGGDYLKILFHVNGRDILSYFILLTFRA